MLNVEHLDFSGKTRHQMKQRDEGILTKQRKQGIVSWGKNLKHRFQHHSFRGKRKRSRENRWDNNGAGNVVVEHEVSVERVREKNKVGCWKSVNRKQTQTQKWRKASNFVQLHEREREWWYQVARYQATSSYLGSIPLSGAKQVL